MELNQIIKEVVEIVGNPKRVVEYNGTLFVEAPTSICEKVTVFLSSQSKIRVSKMGPETVYDFV